MNQIGLMFFLRVIFLIKKHTRKKMPSEYFWPFHGIAILPTALYRFCIILWSFLYTSVKLGNPAYTSMYCIAYNNPSFLLQIHCLPHQGMARFEHVGLFADDGPGYEIVEALCTFCTNTFLVFWLR